jgi:transcriptional regulator with XRE-family HTH domain
MITNDYRKNLGKILKQQRQAVSLTLHELSASSGISLSHLGRIEKGERFPSAAVLQRLARPLGFNEDELFKLAGYLSPDPAAEEENEPVARNELDPYVARMLSQEPVEVQRAILDILNAIKKLPGYSVGSERVFPPGRL